MLPHASRLPIAAASRVRRFGIRAASPQLQLFFLSDSTLSRSMWVIQVPKRIVPLASQRNRTRRILSEAIMQLTQITQGSGRAILAVRQPLTDLKTAEALALLRPLWLRAIGAAT